MLEARAAMAEGNATWYLERKALVAPGQHRAVIAWIGCREIVRPRIVAHLGFYRWSFLGARPDRLLTDSRDSILGLHAGRCNALIG